MVKKSKGQTEVERSGGGLLPSVEGHSLGTRYKVYRMDVWIILSNTHGLSVTS